MSKILSSFELDREQMKSWLAWGRAQTALAQAQEIEAKAKAEYEKNKKAYEDYAKEWESIQA